MLYSTPADTSALRSPDNDPELTNRLYQGFFPVFRDVLSNETHLSLLEDGSIADQHLFDNLPIEWVEEWDADGLPLSLKPTIIAGYWRYGQFFTLADLVQLQGRDA